VAFRDRIRQFQQNIKSIPSIVSHRLQPIAQTIRHPPSPMQVAHGAQTALTHSFVPKGTKVGFVPITPVGAGIVEGGLIKGVKNLVSPSKIGGNYVLQSLNRGGQYLAGETLIKALYSKYTGKNVRDLKNILPSPFGTLAGVSAGFSLVPTAFGIAGAELYNIGKGAKDFFQNTASPFVTNVASDVGAFGGTVVDEIPYYVDRANDKISDAYGSAQNAISAGIPVGITIPPVDVRLSGGGELAGLGALAGLLGLSGGYLLGRRKKYKRTRRRKAHGRRRKVRR